MTSGRPLTDRRTALRLGGGVVALAIGVGAGILDRRGGGDSEPATGPPTEPSTTMTTTPSTTTTEAEPSSTTMSPLTPDELPPGVMAVGTAYIALRPDEGDVESLLTALPSPDGDVLAAARDAIVADFSSGDTVAIDGWMLAVSEARAAAVLTLLCEDGC